MKILFKILIITMCANIVSLGQEKSTGIFQQGTDVGNPAKQGFATFDLVSQIYTIKGGGYNIWFERDEFHYLYNYDKQPQNHN